MSPPLGIYIRPYITQTTGRPGLATADLMLPHRLTAYQHTISAFGGEMAASARLTVTRNGALQWLNVVGASFRVFDARTECVFAGVIETVEVNDGARSFSRTTEGMYNDIQVAYTVNGKPQITAAATNTASWGLFFRRTYVHQAGELTSTQATAMRDQLASAMAWPFENTASGLTNRPTRGEVSVAIMARGWIAALEWTSFRVKPNTASGTSNSDAILRFLLNDSVSSSAPATYGNSLRPVQAYADGVTLSYTGPGLASAPGPITTATPTREFETTLSVVRRIMDMGDSSGNRLAWGMDLFRAKGFDNGLEPLFGAKVWAGDTPNTLTYFALPPVELLNTGWGRVPWTQARPNTMLAVLGGPVQIPRTTGGQDDANRYYVSEVTYDWEDDRGETLRLSPEGDVSASTLLARLR